MARGPLLPGVLAALAVCGCTEQDTVTCSTGLVCPADKVCSGSGNRCIDPGGLDIPDVEIDFGTVSCGATARRTLTLSNPSDEPRSFTVESTLELVHVEPGEGTLQPGETLDVDVMVDATAGPLAVGPRSGAVLFTLGEDVVPRLLEVEIAGALARISEGRVDFGVAALEQLPGPRTITVRNDGNEPMDLQVVAPAAPFTISDTEPSTIEGGQSRDIGVGFEPMLVGNFEGALGLSFSGPLCQVPPLSVGLGGVIDDTSLLISTAVVDFGTSNSCGLPAKTKSLTITSNAGSAQTLKYTLGGANPEAFDVDAKAALGAGEAMTIDVIRNPVARPSMPGTRTATLTITMEPINESVDVELTHFVDAAYLSTSVDAIDFGVVESYSTTFQDMVVVNTGTSPAVADVGPGGGFDLPGEGSLTFSPKTLEVAANSGASEATATATVARDDFEGLELFIVVDATNNCSGPIQREIRLACCVGP